MPVSKTQEWAFASTTPSGTLTMGGGGNRTMIMVQFAEIGGAWDTSAAVGGQAATGQASAFWESGAAGDLHLKAYYWDEAALAAMSGNTVSYSQDKTPSKRTWGYATYSSCDQTTPVIFSEAVSASVGSGGLAVNTASDSNDYIVVSGCRDTINRSFESWDTLTEIFESGNYGAFKPALADGAGGDNSTLVTGDSISDVMLLMGMVVKSTSGAGVGDAIAPLPTISGTGTVGINALKAASAVVAGVAERTMVWIGSNTNLTAPLANTIPSSGSTEFFADNVVFVAPFAAVSADGSRHLNPSIAFDSVLATVEGLGEREITVVADISAPAPIEITNLIAEVPFGGSWSIAKTVYFL